MIKAPEETYASMHAYIGVCMQAGLHARMLLSCATVCTSIQVACLGSLRANQVERLNQDPAMHVDSLLCANEAGYGGGGCGWVEGERSNPLGDTSGINIG